MSKRDWESDTASEEDEPNQDLSIESKLTEERSTENALNLERSAHGPPLKELVVEDDSTAKISTPRSKPRIKRIIHGKKRRLQDVGIRKSPSPSSSPVALPLTPINQERSLPEEAHPKKPQERVFHYSGPKNYFLEDAPVVLTPYQNERTDGGYAIRVVQKGRFVGLVRAGEEKACRELLSKGWKGELRYLGGGLGEIVMRAGNS